MYTGIRQDSPLSTRDQTLLICKDWAQTAFVSATGAALTEFDECGLDASAPCTDAAGNKIDGLLFSQAALQTVD